MFIMIGQEGEQSIEKADERIRKETRDERREAGQGHKTGKQNRDTRQGNRTGAQDRETEQGHKTGKQG